MTPTRDPRNGLICLQGNYVHFAKKKGAKNVGDTRIRFSFVLPDEASAIAYQDAGGRLGPYYTEGGRELLLFERGIRSDQQMFAKAEAENIMIFWLLRFTGLFLMFLSIHLILSPFAVYSALRRFSGILFEWMYYPLHCHYDKFSAKSIDNFYRLDLLSTDLCGRYDCPLDCVLLSDLQSKAAGASQVRGRSCR